MTRDCFDLGQPVDENRDTRRSSVSPRISRQPNSVADLAALSCRRSTWQLATSELARGENAMPVDVLTEIVIERSKDVVAAYAADPTHAPEWYQNIESIEWRSDPHVRLGSRMAFVAYFLGKRLAYEYEVVDYAPGERLVMRTSEGPFPMETTYTWQARGSGATHMSLRNRGEPAGFSRLVAPFMAAAIRRANQKDLAALKRMLETQ
jgi:hypothetical protein